MMWLMPYMSVTQIAPGPSKVLVIVCRHRARRPRCASVKDHV